MIKVNAYIDILRFDWIETYGHLEKEMPRKYQEKYQSDLWLFSNAMVKKGARFDGLSN